MQKIKLDKARKELILKDQTSWGKTKKVKAKLIGDLSNKFDRDLCTFVNIKGLTYVIENAPSEQEEEYEMTLKSAVTIDEELNNRYFAGLDEASKQAILEIQEEYGLS